MALIEDKLYKRIKNEVGRAIADFNLIEEGDRVVFRFDEAERAVALLQQGIEAEAAAGALMARLSPRDADLARLVVDGYGHKEIARRVNSSCTRWSGLRV